MRQEGEIIRYLPTARLNSITTDFSYQLMKHRRFALYRGPPVCHF